MGLGPTVTMLAAMLAASGEGGAARPAEAEAGADQPVALTVEGACPDAAAVEKVLLELLGPGSRGAATIRDEGPRYRIQAGEPSTAITLADPARDCAARARYVAAVLAADLRPHPPVLGPPIWTIEKGVVFDVAPGSGWDVWAPGAEIRGVLGPGRWSLVGAAGARGPATMSLEGPWKVEILRFPLDLGARLNVSWGRFRPWLVFAGSLTANAFLGQDVVESDRQWRLDVGTLVMAGATLRLYKRIGVSAALNFRWQPRRYEMQVTPHGTVGKSPAVWLGLSLSYTIDGRPSSP